MSIWLELFPARRDLAPMRRGRAVAVGYGRSRARGPRVRHSHVVQAVTPFFWRCLLYRKMSFRMVLSDASSCRQTRPPRKIETDAVGTVRVRLADLALDRGDLLSLPPLLVPASAAGSLATGFLAAGLATGFGRRLFRQPRRGCLVAAAAGSIALPPRQNARTAPSSCSLLLTRTSSASEHLITTPSGQPQSYPL